MIIYLLLNKMLHHAFEVCNFLIVKMTHFRCQNRIVIRKITNKTKAEKNLHYTVKKNRWTQIRTSARIFLGIIVRQQSTVCNSPGHLPAISQKEQELFKSSSRLKSVGGGVGGGGTTRNLCLGSGYSTTHKMFVQFAFRLLQWNLDKTNL